MKKILIISSLISLEVLAQSNSVGYLYGNVSGVDGGAVNDCNITVTNDAVGSQRNISVNDDGSFRVASLSVGRYTVNANCDGYNAATLEGLNVNVGSGTNASMTVQVAGSSDTETLDSMTVVGGRISAIDISSVESTTIFSEETYDRLPVARNLTSVALLAPGTTGGDNAFGNLASFGGASVGENAYFINGMDVTNFRNGLGGSSVPFEFYKEFQVKTGGYGVEFGRSTGGVVNAVTKSGTNEWKFGLGAYYTPNTFRKSNYDVFRQDGTLFSSNIRDEVDNLSVYLEAGGPIIKDKLFVYGLYNPRDVPSMNVVGGGTQLFDTERDDAFWGAKIDWFINDDHSLEVTAFSDKQDIVTNTYGYDIDSHTRTDLVGEGVDSIGGENYIAKYTGHFGPNFTVSALAGRSEYDRTSGSSLDNNPAIYDGRGGGALRALGNWVNLAPTFATDIRDQYRLDAEWFINDSHNLRFGLDYQENNSFNLQSYSGGIYWRYYDATPGQEIQGGIVPDGVTQVVRERVFQNGGSFDVISSALYVEDTWTVTDDVTLTMGLRSESFDNKNSNGDSFIKIDNQIAPRFGATWDVDGDGKSKVFFTAGRYHLPIASNTNVRLGGAELFTQTYFALNGLNADDTPMSGAQIGDQAVFGDGSIPNADAIRDANIDPMYQDEFILGYEREILDGIRAGVRYIYRDLGETIEDVAIDAAVIAWAGDRLTLDGETAADVWTGFHQYVLTNPGNDMRVYLPEYGEFADLSAADLGYPNSIRKYNAFEVFFEKIWDGQFTLQGSYTYAISKGNNEGFVRSDNGQDDAGLTTLFDQPGLLDGAYGLLPNDRPHTVKLFGAWEFVQNWQLGFNALMTSGRPINAFGVHPTDVFAAQYGAESFYQNGDLVQRGSRGRTPFRTAVDLSLTYNHDFGWRNATGQFKVDVFNVFDAHTVTEVVETAEEEIGTADPDYLLPTGFQRPQAVRFSANFTF